MKTDKLSTSYIQLQGRGFFPVKSTITSQDPQQSASHTFAVLFQHVLVNFPNYKFYLFPWFFVRMLMSTKYTVSGGIVFYIKGLVILPSKCAYFFGASGTNPSLTTS